MADLLAADLHSHPFEGTTTSTLVLGMSKIRFAQYRTIEHIAYYNAILLNNSGIQYT
jgi:hypothetical protein